MPEGAIILDRQFFNKDEWLSAAKNGGFTRGMAWLDLLALTNQKNAEATIRGIRLNVERGECAWSKAGLMSRWGRSWSWITATVKIWETEGRVTVRKSDNETTVLHVTNFDAYQTSLAEALNEEQIGTKKGANRDQLGTERGIGDGITKYQGGMGKGVDDGGAGRLPEQVGDEEMIAFGRQFPGEPATGAPKMPDEWIFEAVVKINGRTNPPADWRKLMVALWRNEFRGWLGGQGKKKPAAGGGELSPNVLAIQGQVRQRQLEAQLRELEDEVHQDRQGNQPRDPKKIARLRELRAEVEKLKANQ